MPGVKDITRDIGKLRKRDLPPKAEAPALLQRLERQPAFNASGVFSWIVICFFLALQVFFLFWLAL